MNKKFNIPIVLFIFKRKDTVLKILDQIRKIAPTKIYLMADAGRDEAEQLLVDECRLAVEAAIDWECTVIKNYAETNRGVHENIGMGAMWVFEREKEAIFLEDDNYPALSFFQYCEECLQKYRDNEEIFWICGTNYLQKCIPKNGASVFKSQHLMPCGWASWANKFNTLYDYDMKMADEAGWEKKLRTKYKDKRLYVQQRGGFRAEHNRRVNGERYRSWDYHTSFSIKMQDLWGIEPKYNQIENIGVDEYSTHGGNSFNLEMTRRFCGIKAYELDTPLILPQADELDSSFEKQIGKIILYPFKERMIMNAREFLHLPDNIRLRQALSFYLGKNRK